MDSHLNFVENLAPTVNNISKTVGKCPFSVDNPVENGTFWQTLLRSERSKFGGRGNGADYALDSLPATRPGSYPGLRIQ